MWGWMQHGWWMWVWPLLLVALVAWIVWMISRSMRGPPHENAEEVLRRRYAAGEIDEAEYEQRLRELRET